jgi:hypothetical protein
MGRNALNRASAKAVGLPVHCMKTIAQLRDDRFQIFSVNLDCSVLIN